MLSFLLCIALHVVSSCPSVLFLLANCESVKELLKIMCFTHFLCIRMYIKDQLCDIKQTPLIICWSWGWWHQHFVIHHVYRGCGFLFPVIRIRTNVLLQSCSTLNYLCINMHVWITKKKKKIRDQTDLLGPKQTVTWLISNFKLLSVCHFLKECRSTCVWIWAFSV